MRLSALALLVALVPAARAQDQFFKSPDPRFFDPNGQKQTFVSPDTNITFNATKERCAIRLIEVPVPQIDQKALVKLDAQVDKAIVVEPLAPACPAKPTSMWQSRRK